MQGNGTTVVNGESFEWGPGDFIAIPPWAWYEHANTTQNAATLFQVNDIPALQALGLYRDEFAAV